MVSEKLVVGQLVLFALAIPEFGIHAGAEGVVVDGANCHLLNVPSFPVVGESVNVAVFGKTLILPVEFFDESAGNISANSEAGIASGQSIAAGAGDGKVVETGIVDSGAVAGAKPYSVAQAIGELANLAVQLDHDHDSVSSAQVFEIVGKMQTIAA